MLLAGDDVGNTQLGNNNAYCQDNHLTWLDWPDKPSQHKISAFVSCLIAARKQVSLLRQSHFLHGEVQDTYQNFPNASWLNQSTLPMSKDEWNNPEHKFLALLLVGNTEDNPKAAIITINNSNDDVCFQLDSEHLPNIWNGWQLWHGISGRLALEYALIACCVFLPCPARFQSYVYR